MPIYEYKCMACGHCFDCRQRFKDEALVNCPECSRATLKKMISSPAFHLKGSGWYVTDFKNPQKPSQDRAEKQPEKQEAPEKNEKKEDTSTVKSPEENKPSSKPKITPPVEKSS